MADSSERFTLSFVVFSALGDFITDILYVSTQEFFNFGLKLFCVISLFAPLLGFIIVSLPSFLPWWWKQPYVFAFRRWVFVPYIIYNHFKEKKETSEIEMTSSKTKSFINLIHEFYKFAFTLLRNFFQYFIELFFNFINTSKRIFNSRYLNYWPDEWRRIEHFFLSMFCVFLKYVVFPPIVFVICLIYIAMALVTLLLTIVISCIGFIVCFLILPTLILVLLVGSLLAIIVLIAVYEAALVVAAIISILPHFIALSVLAAGKMSCLEQTKYWLTENNTLKTSPIFFNTTLALEAIFESIPQLIICTLNTWKYNYNDMEGTNFVLWLATTIFSLLVILKILWSIGWMFLKTKSDSILKKCVVTLEKDIFSIGQSNVMSYITKCLTACWSGLKECLAACWSGLKECLEAYWFMIPIAVILSSFLFDIIFLALIFPDRCIRYISGTLIASLCAGVFLFLGGIVPHIPFIMCISYLLADDFFAENHSAAFSIFVLIFSIIALIVNIGFSLSLMYKDYKWGKTIIGIALISFLAFFVIMTGFWMQIRKIECFASDDFCFCTAASISAAEEVCDYSYRMEAPSCYYDFDVAGWCDSLNATHCTNIEIQVDSWTKDEKCECFSSSSRTIHNPLLTICLASIILLVTSL